MHQNQIQKNIRWDHKSAPRTETQYMTLMKDIAGKIKTKLEKEISSY